MTYGDSLSTNSGELQLQVTGSKVKVEQEFFKSSFLLKVNRLSSVNNSN